MELGCAYYRISNRTLGLSEVSADKKKPTADDEERDAMQLADIQLCVNTLKLNQVNYSGSLIILIQLVEFVE
jgi:hypothetical protein